MSFKTNQRYPVTAEDIRNYDVIMSAGKLLEDFEYISAFAEIPVQEITKSMAYLVKIRIEVSQWPNATEVSLPNDMCDHMIQWIKWVRQFGKITRK